MRKNNYWLIAGVINLFTAILHLVGGQITLVDPMLQSELSAQVKTELVGAWHIVTIVLYFTSIVLLKHGLKPRNEQGKTLIQFIGINYVFFAGCFMVSSVVFVQFAPQWVLLLPIGIVALLGNRSRVTN